MKLGVHYKTREDIASCSPRSKAISVILNGPPGFPRAAALALAALLSLLPGCSGTGVNAFLFGGVREQNVARAPAGATTYRCDGGKRFFVRNLDAAVWVILPEREFRLNKATSASGQRYSNGISTFEISDSAATLWDGTTVTHASCKASTE